MLQTLIYTWILQYSSTGVKCAFLYILLIVFTLDSICCFKAPGIKRQQLEEFFAIVMSSGVRLCFPPHSLCVSDCESFPQRHTGWENLKGKVFLRCLGGSCQQNMTLLCSSGSHTESSSEVNVVDICQLTDTSRFMSYTFSFAWMRFSIFVDIVTVDQLSYLYLVYGI